MASNESGYIIVDEPKVRALAAFVLPPMVILFASIFLPIFWQPPAMGQYWLPLVWIFFNGYILGSSTLKKEILVGSLGLLVMSAQFMGFLYYISLETHPFPVDVVGPYLRICLNATLFLTLYFVVFTQTTSFELYEYMKEND